MSLFDLFKKEKKLDLPKDYEGIVTKEDYNSIMDISIQYHKDKGAEITSIGDGEIVTNVNGEEQRWYLDNLVRALVSNEKENWETMIQTHFDKLKDNSSAYNYFFNDFEYASQFLRVLLKSDDIVLGDDLENYVNRTDFPGTITFLVMEFEEQFRYIRREDITEWATPEEELFRIAIENIPDEEVEAKEYLYHDKFTVYIFFSGDFASALMLDLENRADYTLGTYGTLVAIPTKGTAFAHPIENRDVLELVEYLNPSVVQFFQEDPGSITTNYYWYHEGKFTAFPINKDQDGRFVTLPDELWLLLKNAD